MFYFRIWYTVPNGITHYEFPGGNEMEARQKFQEQYPGARVEMIILMPAAKPSALPQQLLF